MGAGAGVQNKCVESKGVRVAGALNGCRCRCAEQVCGIKGGAGGKHTEWVRCAERAWVQAWGMGGGEGARNGCRHVEWVRVQAHRMKGVRVHT
jgi:hypothetical protein